jgi:hypothetical protein
VSLLVHGCTGWSFIRRLQLHGLRAINSRVLETLFHTTDNIRIYANGSDCTARCLTDHERESREAARSPLLLQTLVVCAESRTGQIIDLSAFCYWKMPTLIPVSIELPPMVHKFDCPSPTGTRTSERPCARYRRTGTRYSRHRGVRLTHFATSDSSDLPKHWISPLSSLGLC